MKVINYDHSQYTGLISRYDLNYWKRIHYKYLSITKDELENNIEEVINELKTNSINILNILVPSLTKNIELELPDLSGENILDLENLSKLACIRELHIAGGSYRNVHHLENMHHLEGLYISAGKANKHLPNLSKLIKLKYLEIHFGECKNMMIGLEKISSLETLILSNYKPALGLKNWNLPNLLNLELVSSNISTLEGLEYSQNMRCLTIFYCKQLQDIKSIGYMKKLEFLEFEKCKILHNIDELVKCKNLKLFAMNYCGEIENVLLFKGMKNLENVGFIGTNIKSCDLSPLQNIPIAGFDNKKAYNYKCQNFKMIKK